MDTVFPGVNKEMTPELMLKAGKESQNYFFSNNELDLQLKAMELVINFLKGRGDCKIIVDRLELEQSQFQAFKENRKEKTVNSNPWSTLEGPKGI